MVKNKLISIVLAALSLTSIAAKPEANYFERKQAEKLFKSNTSQKKGLSSIIEAVNSFDAKFSHKNDSNTTDLKIMVDDEYVKFNNKNWQKTLEETLLVLIKNFEREFGIKLKVSQVEYFDSINNIHSFSHLLGQADLSGNEMDAVLIFTGEYEGASVAGRGELGGCSAIIGLGSNETVTTVHEVGHLFGATDISDGEGVMGYKNTHGSLEWDEKNRTRINANKNKKWNCYQGARAKEENKRLSRISDSQEKKLMIIAYLLDISYGKDPKIKIIPNKDTRREFLKLAVEKYPNNYYLNYKYATYLEGDEARGYYLKAYQDPFVKEDRECLASIMYGLKNIGKDTQLVKTIQDTLNKTNPFFQD